MIQQYIVVGLLALLSGASTVWIARRMFERCADHRNSDVAGITPMFWRVRDSFIGRMIEVMMKSRHMRRHPPEALPPNSQMFVDAWQTQTKNADMPANKQSKGQGKNRSGMQKET